MVVPRIDPPVGIRGLPTIDFLFSGRTGCSQSCRAGIDENDRMHVDGLRDVQDLRESFWFRLDRVEHSIEELVIMLCDRRYRKQAASCQLHALAVARNWSYRRV
jgi:hypothetical protein